MITTREEGGRVSDAAMPEQPTELRWNSPEVAPPLAMASRFCPARASSVCRLRKMQAVYLGNLIARLSFGCSYFFGKAVP